MSIYCLCVFFATAPYLQYIWSSIPVLMVKHFHVTIRNHVASSGNRFWIYLTARQLNIKGFVAENPEEITIEAEGEQDNLNKFIQSCQNIPCNKTSLEININEKRRMFYDEFFIM